MTACVRSLVLGWVLLAPSVWAQNDWDGRIVGPGFADVSVHELAESGTPLTFFGSERSTEPAFIVLFGAPEDGYPIVEAPSWFTGGSGLLDFGLLQFPVMELNEKRLLVQTADGPYWVERGRGVAYLPWATYLTEHVTGLDRIDPATNPLREAPDPAAEERSFTFPEAEGWECLAAAEVRGEWLRVERSELCWQPDAEPLDGWIRWREGDRLLISYGLVC